MENPHHILVKKLKKNLDICLKKFRHHFKNIVLKTERIFLSYSYVIHKFIQLLGIDEYLEYFPLLKSREKLYQQDKIWKNICLELDWLFIHSI